MKYHVGTTEINGIKYRKCRHCREIKELNTNNFLKRNTENGWRGKCRICFNKDARLKQETTKTELESGKKYRLKYKKEKPLEAIYKTARGNAKRTFKEFTIVLNDLLRLWQIQNGICFYTNKPMLFEIGFDNSVSIDRIDSNKGYIADNIVLCQKKTNIMKNNASIEELVEFAENIVNNKNNIISKLPINIPMSL
jgi:hypothetical protein